MKYITILVLLIILTSCQSKSLKIITKPKGSEVKIFDPQTGLSKKVGKTPLVINNKTRIPEGLKDQPIWNLSIHHKGYAIEHIILDRSINSNFKITSNLKKLSDWIDKKDDRISILANNVGTQIQQINRSIQKGLLENALKKTKKLIDLYPKSSIFYDIKGSIHLLMSEKEEAKASYSKSLFLNPDNSETISILKKLK